MEPRTLLSNQKLETGMKMANDNIVLIEGWHTNDINWPHAYLCMGKNGKVTLENTINVIITLGLLKLRLLKLVKLKKLTLTRYLTPNHTPSTSLLTSLLRN